jgi:ABC-type lipoprotein export system ATPase subunit
VTHDNSLAPRFSRHLIIQDGEIVPNSVQDAESRQPGKSRRKQ